MDNARPHHAKDLEMEWLPHPPYSHDFSPFNCQGFRSLENFCRWRHFKNRRDVEFTLRTWIATKPQNFWRRGLEKLPERWGTIVKHNYGKYYDDRRNASIIDTCPKVKILKKCHYLCHHNTFCIPSKFTGTARFNELAVFIRLCETSVPKNGFVR